MEWVRVALNPWGEEVVLGLAWNVAWLVAVVTAIGLVGHALLANKREDRVTRAPVDPAVVAAVPAHVTRHNKSARISHWLLAASTLTLLVTAFVPMLGLQFPWLTIHWVAGLVLGVYIVYHILDTTVRLSWGKMWIGFRDIGESFSRVRDFFGRADNAETHPGKWALENKLFHHVTALAGFAVVITGVLMMARLDTWFWSANPYVLEISDADWGTVFLIHGVASVAFVGLIMLHLYLAFRPDNLWITRSMIKGWITRDEYLEHHHPDRWKLSKNGDRPQPRREEAVTAGSSTPSSASRD
jgi:cytochrome b subunit of formate dehydrogenase